MVLMEARNKSAGALLALFLTLLHVNKVSVFTERIFTMEFTLNIDLSRYTVKPQDSEVGRIVTRLKNRKSIRTDITVERLINAITRGHCFTSCVMVGTKSSDWQQQQVFCWDFDNALMPHVQPNEAASVLAANGVPVSFMYYSFSHTKEHPRFRIIAICDEAITDRAVSESITNGVLELWPKKSGVSQIDFKCGTLGHFFYGTNKGLIDGVGKLDARFSKIAALELSRKLNTVETVAPQFTPIPSAYRFTEAFRKNKLAIGIELTNIS